MTSQRRGEHAGPGRPGCACEQAVDRLWDYLDGELDAAEREAINTHLNHCPTCLRMLNDESALKQLLARACSNDCAPPELRNWVTTQFAAWRVEIRGGQTAYSRTTFTVTRPFGDAQNGPAGTG